MAKYYNKPGQVCVDDHGNQLNVGDKVMYITDGPRVNYGIIKKMAETQCPWNKKYYGIRISVWKEKGGYTDKPTMVTLTYPTIFKCGVTLNYPVEKK